MAPRAAHAQEPEPVSEWRVHWDDGLYYRFIQHIPVSRDDRVLARIDDRLGLAGKINARVETDFAAYAGETEQLGIDDGAEFRRIYLGTTGELFLLTHAWYSVTVEFQNSGAELGDTFLQWRDRPWVGTITVGNFSPAFSLEAQTSSRDITFMEQAAPVDAFAPSRAFGVQIGKPVFEERATWALGAFTGAALGEPDVGDASNDIGRFAGRVTWLARDDPENQEFLHLGLSTGFVFTNGDARFQTRPESHIAPHVIDTDDIDSDRAASISLETAWVRGPWSVQGELLQSLLASKDEGRLNFGGAYVYASCFLTGESRPYDPTSGSFSQLVPLRPFSLEKHQYGAFEVGARIARADLNDRAIDGGVLDELNVGGTWYFDRHFHAQLEAGYARVHGRTDLSGAQSFGLVQLRIGAYY